MRRFIAGLLVFFLTASVVSLVSEPASAANPSKLGPHVAYVNTKSRTIAFYIGGKWAYKYPYSEFRVRGNSSRAWPKKSYGVIFKQQHAPLKLKPGKEFRFQANYRDRSLMRNWISYELARHMTGLRWTPRQVYTELFIDNKYQGSYLLLETIERGPNRVAIGNNGQIAEFANDGSFIDRTGMRTKLQDPEIGSRGDDLMKIVNKFTWRLSTGSPDWKQSIDLSSFVDYYLVREFTKDKDADFLFSNYYYTPDVFNQYSKLYMGPVWDFDRSAGVEAGTTTTTVASPKGWWLRGQGAHHPWDYRHWYVKLTKNKTFRTLLCNRFNATKGYFQWTRGAGISAAYKALGGGQVVTNDRRLWNSATFDRPPARGSYEDEIEYLSNWYAHRYYWMRDNICK